MAKQKIAIFYGDKQNKGDYDNGVHMDILDIPYIQNINEAGNYDVVIRTLWIEGIGWGQEIKEKFPNVIQIGLSDHPLSAHISKMDGMRQTRYIRDLQYLDAIMTLTEEERQWYQLAAPSKPVIKIGLPFPFETYEDRYGKFVGSPKKYIGLGVGGSDNDRNFISNVLVFERLRIDNPDLQGVFLSVPENLLPYCTLLAKTFPNLFIQERVGMNEFYDILSQCHLVINLADRNTPGRLQGEAAFFRVPVVGSNRFELQNELFPTLAVTPYALEDAYWRATAILNDDVDIKAITDRAYGKLEQYNYTHTRRKFNKLLKAVS